MSTQDRTTEIEFIIAGSDTGTGYTLWDVAPAPTDPTRRAIVLEELDVDAFDAFGTVTTEWATSPRQAVNKLLGQLREQSGLDDYWLNPDSQMASYYADAPTAPTAAAGWSSVLSATPATSYQVCASSLPGPAVFVLDGLPRRHTNETRDRVRAAVLNSGLTFPTTNLLVKVTAIRPADKDRSTSGLDLAIACTALAAAGQFPAGHLAGAALVGELGLDGQVRTPHDIHSLLRAVADTGGTTVLVPNEAADIEIPGVQLIGVGSLDEALAVLTGNWHHPEGCTHCTDDNQPHPPCRNEARCPDCCLDAVTPVGA